jgi:hypothetical protein
MRGLSAGAFEMRRFSIFATGLAFLGFAGADGAAAAGNMGDPSAHQRELQEICDKQKRGEIPGYPSGCPSWDIDPPANSKASR